MRLHELISVRKYKDKSLEDVLKDFSAGGGEVLGSGKHGTVIWHPSWQYVFKFFVKDDEYLRFIRWARRNQSLIALPRILGGPWRIVPFYRRAMSDPYLYVVKLERLEPINDPELHKNLINWLNGYHLAVDDQKPDADAGVEGYRQALADEQAATTKRDRKAVQEAGARLDQFLDWRHLSAMRLVWDRYPSLKSLMLAYGEFAKTQLDGQEDLHIKNFMQRPDGGLVMIDPLWGGEPLYLQCDPDQRGAFDYDEPETPPQDDTNSLAGGVLPRRKGVRSGGRDKPVAAPSQTPPPDDGDLPF